MTGQLLLTAILAGLFAGWLTGLVAGRGVHGLTADLTLGLAGGTVVVSILQAVGVIEYAGLIGVMIVAFLGAVAIVLLERGVRNMRA
jgi:uncharacterized membrane protein YeaQ/YmgE (transglycosylase-associated protein family)